MSFLETWGFGPKKALSQNFLIDGNVVAKIARSAQIGPGDVVLEIGPGPGALTQELLSLGATVVAVEMDSGFARALSRLQTEDNRLHVHAGDVMKVDLGAILGPHLAAGKKAKVVSNLPYSLTSPILGLIAPRNDLFCTFTVMVQHEVAERACSAPGSRTYGALTVFLAFYCQLSYAFKVSHNCFYPKPKVDSAIIHGVLHTSLPHADPEKFLRFMHTAFQMRRKMLRSSLKELYGADLVMNSLTHMGLNPLARPEELSLDQWVLLLNTLSLPPADAEGSQ